VTRRDFVKSCSCAVAARPLLLSEAPAASGALVFTKKYLDLRHRFQRDFVHDGQIAGIADADYRKVLDQTFHMGFALVTLAGEARLLADARQDPGPTERLLRQLLQGIEQCEGAAQKVYKTSMAGFFLRDAITTPWAGVMTVDYDNKGNPGDADMSIDQLISLMMGWWAATHWSTDETNRRLARAQAGRAMKYLMDERFMIDKPGTRSPVPGGGDDARAAAGFLCHIGGEITGQDYYGSGKVRLQHDNRCHTCGGTGQVNIPNPNLECPGCRGTGHAKIVVGGGKCLACNGSGEVKIVTESDCPTCSGSGEVRVVVTDFFGHDHVLGRTKCGLCGGSGKIGGKTDLGKCKVCHGSGRLPSYTKDLGKCKLCGGSGRMKAELPKMKCPVCGGSKELNLDVHLTHPIVLALEPVALTALYAPRVGYHSGKIIIEGDNRSAAKPYVRHMNLVLLALDPAVPDEALLAAALDSKHPWAVILRAAKNNSVCRACHGKGTVSVFAPDAVHAGDPLHMHVTFKQHDLGKCKVCNGTGHNPNPELPRRLVTAAVADQLRRLHRECPAEGPNAHAPLNWAVTNHWERCTGLERGNGNNRYNGLDFLSMEVLMRLAGLGSRLS
jgi:hypothetical protein